MKKYPKAAILLSTYNGEKYLREMIESVLNQDYPNLTLYIRDDGSTDGTADIINEYIKKTDKIVYVDDKKHRGYPACFYALTDRCQKDINADYYFFSDQDDVWLPEKVRRAVLAIRRKEKETGVDRAIAYYAGYTICDENLNKTGCSKKVTNKFSLTNTMFQVCGLEFTMAVNNAAISLLSAIKPCRADARGTWMSMLYASLGTVIYDNRQVALYRRNEGAVTAKKMNFAGIFIWRIKNFLINDEFSRYRILLEDFYDRAHSALTSEDEKMLRLFAKQHSIGDRIKKVFYKKRLRSGLIDEICIRFAFLIGKL